MANAKQSRKPAPKTFPVSECSECKRLGDWDDTDEGYSPCCNKHTEGALVTAAQYNANRWG